MSFVNDDHIVQFWEYAWEKLTCVGSNRKKHWLMIEDFNEITGNHKKMWEIEVDYIFSPF